MTSNNTEYQAELAEPVQQPEPMLQPELVLLCHPTELARPTNTGQLVLDTLAAAPAQTAWRGRQISWQRRVPDQALLDAINQRQYVLLFPSQHAVQLRFDAPLVPAQLAGGKLPDGVILLDATWQQAQKMYNQSPYLQSLPHWQGSADYQSTFNLRRNQRQGAWCTAETVALMWQAWQIAGASALSDALWHRFAEFNQRR